MAGYFYVGCYSANDTFRLIPRPVDGAAKLATCAAIEEPIPVASLGRIRFSGGASEAGCNPCDGPCDPCVGPGCGPDGDLTPPDAVVDLEVTATGSNFARLAWTAPADNPGGSGVVNYDLRYSTSPLTAGNFDAAPQAPAPAPGAPGSTETAAIHGLSSNVLYYFALRSSDAGLNVSPISNVVSASTIPGPGGGGTLQETKIALHVAPATRSPGGACTAGALADCSSDVVTKGDLLPTHHFVFVLGAHYANLAGLEWGIQYDDGASGGLDDQQALDILSWTLCASLEFPTPIPNAWPRPGSGNLVVWDTINRCQNGPVAVAGYFYVGAYDPDILRVTPRPVSGIAGAANCASASTELPLEALGEAVFSAGAVTPGYNPCRDGIGAPVQPATWSKIKTLVR